MRFVLDNSVTMRWLFRDGATDNLAYASRVLEGMEKQRMEALVPSLWGLEVANVIVRGEAKGLLTEARSTEFVGLLRQMAITSDATPLMTVFGDILQLARRHGLSSYDAAYLELSLRVGVPLATLDDALRRAVRSTDGRLF